MSNPRAACGPVEGFVRPSLGFAAVKVSYVLTTCPYFDNLEFDILDAGGLQIHFITSVATAFRIRTLSVHWLKAAVHNLWPQAFDNEICGRPHVI